MFKFQRWSGYQHAIRIIYTTDHSEVIYARFRQDDTRFWVKVADY